MKIQSNATTNFNHVQQHKESVTLEKVTDINGKERKFLFDTTLSKDILQATQSLQENNEAVSMLQVLEESIGTLFQNTRRLQELSRRHEIVTKDKMILEDEFSRVNESMMDTIDNSVFNGRQLFGGDYAFILDDGRAFVSLHAIGNVDSLEITEQEGLENFKQQLETIGRDIRETTQFLVTSANNTLAAMSTKTTAVSQDELLSLKVSDVSLEGMKEAHNSTLLQKKVESLLK